MVDIQNASLTKERILSLINSRGPSLPVSIAKAVNVQPLFAAAFLSELYGERRLKMSFLRVGSSPLYFIEGQEPMLENFIQFLNHKEKEAFQILKQSKLLLDEEQHPAIRVALRSIKDFAIPMKIKVNDQDKLFWRYFQLPELEVDNHLNKFNKQNTKPLQPEQKIEVEKIETKNQTEENPIEKGKEINKLNLAPAQTPIQIIHPKEKKRKPFDSKFSSNLKEYLLSKDIELLQMVLEKKKEVTAKIRIDTLLGKQEYLLFAKDKKKITEEDLIISLQKAQTEKLPALIIAPGEIDKKALEYYKTWNNLIKFEKAKL